MNDLETRLSTFLKPYVSRQSSDGTVLTVLTWTQSLNAKVAPAAATLVPLSSLEAQYTAHLIRRQVDAILIDAKTALTNTPTLGVTRTPDRS
jgi:riboflavin biosynthesis pyrimidine reductase